MNFVINIIDINISNLWKFLLFSAHIYNMEGKLSIRNVEIQRFFRCLPIGNVRFRLLRTLSDREFFSTKL